MPLFLKEIYSETRNMYTVSVSMVTAGLQSVAVL